MRDNGDCVGGLKIMLIFYFNIINYNDDNDDDDNKNKTNFVMIL
jgi:hypothetical protein